MSVQEAPNAPDPLVGLSAQTDTSRLATTKVTKRPNVAVTRRLNGTIVGSFGPHQLPAGKLSRVEITNCIRGAVERWNLMETHNLLYKYSSINTGELRLLYLQPAQRYEQDIFVEIVVTPDEHAGPADSQQPYEALSYHWGPGPADKPVYLCKTKSTTQLEDSEIRKLRNIIPDFKNGQRLYVRPNLDKALRGLRRKDQIVVLWVDAICINQHDEKVEKPAQISKIKQIYNRATNVCIWLEDGRGASDNKDKSEDYYAAMEFIRPILRLDRVERLLHKRFINEWNNLLELMRSSVFSRRWVIQELASAREATVHYGTVYVRWRDFAEAIDIIALDFDKIRSFLGESQDTNFSRSFESPNNLQPLETKVLLDSVSNVFRKNADGTIFEPTSNLEALVSSLASFKSSDPRDSIFSLLNIARDSMLLSSEGMNIVSFPKPNYEKSLLEVYTDLLEWIVHSTGSLDMICRRWAAPGRATSSGSGNHPSLSTLPSWIQTIQKSTSSTRGRWLSSPINGDSLVGSAGERRYNASLEKKPKVRFGARAGDFHVHSTPAARSSIESLSASLITTAIPIGNSNLPPNITPSHILHAEGIIIGKIVWHSNPITSGVITRPSLEKGGWRFDEQPKGEVPDKLWRTMVADRDPHGKNTFPWYRRAALHTMTLVDDNGNLATQELRREGGVTDKKKPQIVADFLKRVQGVTSNRSFIEVIPDGPKTDDMEPLFGVGSPETQWGDLICILFGCSVPCILRRCRAGQDGEYFKFLGEAYVHGLMDGEGIAMLSDEELENKAVGFAVV